MAKKKKAVKATAKTKKTNWDSDAEESADEGDEEDEDEEEAPKRKAAPKRQAAPKARDSGGSVYKIIEVVGSSTKSWEHAAQVAVDRASQTLEDLRVAEVVDQDLKIEDGKIASFRTKLRLSFKFRD